MARASKFIEFIGIATILLEICAADSDTECAPGSEAPGHSMLQTRRQRTAPSYSNTYASNSLLMSAMIRERHKVSQQPEGSKLFLGSLMTLDEKGFQTVVGTCCHLEMELYIRRLITSLDLQVCNEAQLLAILPLYSTCETGVRDFSTLQGHILASRSDPVCAMVAPVGACPLQQTGCMADPAPASHRRRQCLSHAQRPNVGEAAQCPLPRGALWCEVRLKNQAPFFMAVYDWSVAEDWVSYNICGSGFWEESDMSEFGAPGNMLDIGGNIGYHAFAFAHSGWTVTTFEPMPSNLELMKATLCRNPQLAAKITVMPIGLGAATQSCRMMVPKDNVGDGFTKCGRVIGEHPTPGFISLGNFSMRRLDEVLLEQAITQVDVVKVDVEGYEYQVFAGAPDFLKQYHPRLIKSELWDRMANSTGGSYLDLFLGAGYETFSDTKCQVPLDAKQEVRKGGVDAVMCLSKEVKSQLALGTFQR